MSEFVQTNVTYNGEGFYDWIGPDGVEYEIEFTVLVHGPGRDDNVPDTVEAEKPDNMSEDMWDESCETIEDEISIYAGDQIAKQLREGS